MSLYRRTAEQLAGDYDLTIIKTKGGDDMATQAELVKDSLHRIKRLELAIEKEPESKELKNLLSEERVILDEVQKSN